MFLFSLRHFCCLAAGGVSGARFRDSHQFQRLSSPVVYTSRYYLIGSSVAQKENNKIQEEEQSIRK